MSLSPSVGITPTWVNQKELNDYERGKIKMLTHYVLKADCPLPAALVAADGSILEVSGGKCKRKPTRP